MTQVVAIAVSTGVIVGTNSALTFSHTVAAGTDKFLTVAVTLKNSSSQVVSGVDFNSVAMTFVGADERGTRVRTELWRLINPTVGTFNVDITLDAALDEADAALFGAAIDYDEAHQTVPLGSVATANGEDTNPTIVVSSGGDELVVDCVGSGAGGASTLTVGAGQTQRYNPGIQGGGGRRILPGGSTEAGPGMVTMDWTILDSQSWAIVGVSILPATAPPVVPPTVDAGGPYNGDVDTAIALDATVTPGSDPTPVLLWTIFSGPGGGVFSNDAIEDPTFTPDTVGSYVLQLSADPNDGPAVLDTANLESDDVPPVVDAGGPYNGPSGQATALDATVTPGSDPTPVLLWTIDSGGAGSFSNDAIEDPTFTPTFPTVGPYVLRLTVTPSDGPAVFDTANFESDPVAPIVDAGGPYAGGVSTPIALDATVTPGTDPAPTLLWTIDSGGTGTFSDDTIEDPTFTGDAIGAYVLRLTVTPSDGPDVFDTAALTTAALADAVFLGGRLLRGGTGDLVMSQLALGADPPGGDVVFIKGTAHSNAGAMYVALDDGVVSRVHIAGIAHQQNGVRLVTFNPPLVSLNAWGLDANGAQGVAVSGAGQPHEGVLLRGDGQMVVDGVAPPPIGPPALASLVHWYDFDDLSTLWQDLAGTIPITTPGQSIQRVDDKGTFGTDLTDASVGQFRSPFWQITGGTGEYSSPPGGFNKALSSQVSPGIGGLERTIAWVVDRDDADTGTVYPSAWHLNGGVAVDQFSGNNLQGFSNSVGVNGLFVSRALLGALFLHKFPSNMELYDSQHSGFLPGANATFTEPIANRDLTVGAVSAGSGNDWRGTIKAVFYWNGALTAQEIQDFKDFTTAKYGLAWA